MAKDILIVPGSSNIHFSGSAVNDIKLETQDNGSVAFTSTSGSLFTITNSLTGSLFSVGDVSGVPILDVNSDDTVTLGQFSSPIKVLTNASGHTMVSGSSTSTGSFGKIEGSVTIPSGKALKTSLIKGGSNVEIDTDGARVVLTDSALRVGVSSLSDVYTANIVVGSTTPALFLDDSDVSNLRHSIVGGGNAGLEISADIHNATTGYINFGVGGSSVVRFIEGGKVGIGTTSPGSMLEIWQGVGNGSSYDVIKIDGNTGNYGGMWISGQWANGQQGRIGFYGTGTASSTRGVGLIGGTGTTPQLFVSSTGNVGIGTVTPDSMLEVYKDVNTNNAALLKGNINYSAITLQGTYTNGYFLPALSWSTNNQASTAPKAQIRVFADSGGSKMYFGTSNSYSSGVTNDAITIDASGNVGINNTSPSAKLEVSGKMFFSVIDAAC